MSEPEYKGRSFLPLSQCLWSSHKAAINAWLTHLQSLDQVKSKIIWWKYKLDIFANNSPKLSLSWVNYGKQKSHWNRFCGGWIFLEQVVFRSFQGLPWVAALAGRYVFSQLGWNPLQPLVSGYYCTDWVRYHVCVYWIQVGSIYLPNYAHLIVLNKIEK